MNRTDTMLRGAARGAIAAMAMSGLRRVTAPLGIVEETPPESILRRQASGLFHRLPERHRPALVEAVHWTYGAVGGALFGAVPRQWRRRPWTGLGYGLLFWTAFEIAIAPALGLREGRTGKPTERLALLADHLLYGIVVAAAPWPHRD